MKFAGESESVVSLETAGTVLSMSEAGSVPASSCHMLISGNEKVRRCKRKDNANSNAWIVPKIAKSTKSRWRASSSYSL